LVDETSCVGCRQCMPIAHCDAITYDSAAKKCAVDEDLCVGCGFCRGVCPKDAITYVLKKGK
ncbi:4Fe-4S binding protein, partial [Enterocloster citroniae]